VQESYELAQIFQTIGDLLKEEIPHQGQRENACPSSKLEKNGQGTMYDTLSTRLLSDKGVYVDTYQKRFAYIVLNGVDRLLKKGTLPAVCRFIWICPWYPDIMWAIKQQEGVQNESSVFL